MKLLHKKGFTLPEILTAVVIVGILTMMALPYYEKTIERSRMTEARTLLSRLQDAKLTAMDNMDLTTYDPNVISLAHLSVSFVPANAAGQTFQTRSFEYSLRPSGTVDGSSVVNGVCAVRLGGDYAGTMFLYYGGDPDRAPFFVCQGNACEDYGLSNTQNWSCSTSN